MRLSRRGLLMVVLAGVTVALAMGLLLTAAPGAVEAGPAAAPSANYLCTPTAVGVFDNRVHVRCSVAAPGGIGYFAYCTAPDSAGASRFLSAFTTAKVTGKNLMIFYDSAGTSGNACGCFSGDCRAIFGAEVQL